ncbi:MAG TPA: HEPN domain-containing protein, partial [Pirellulales bacterium]|nr:HEPN domain-containing protein [Pirellulales bacterium]
ATTRRSLALRVFPLRAEPVRSPPTCRAPPQAAPPSRSKLAPISRSVPRDVYARARAIPLGLSLACEGAYLSACAQFEQGVRDLIEEAAMKAAAKKGTFALLPPEMQNCHTNGCGNILQNLAQDKFGHLTAAGIVSALHGCVVTGAPPISLNVEAFSSNERNFKPQIISEHVKRLGVKKVWSLIRLQPSLQSHFGTASSDDAEKFARERLERIMDKRNTIIHRGKGFAAPSDDEVRECARFFTVLIESLAHVLVDYIATL